ncbi:MAG: hypothetical protein ABMB14_32340, partial [Myxococcota bacterium]
GELPSLIDSADLSDNRAPVGAALEVMGIGVALDAVSVVRNVALAGGGAIGVGEDGQVDAVGCDLGSDVDDNGPTDVAYDDGTAYAYGFGSFSCSDVGCTE